MPSKKKLANQLLEQQAAHARLTAGNVRTLSQAVIGDRAFADYFGALKRLGDRFPLETSKELLQSCIDLLQTSELTINIVSTSFFSNPIADEWYGNCWTRNMGSNKRDNTEKSMFAYAGISSPKVTSVFGSKLGTDAQDKKDRLATVIGEVSDAGADRTAATFQPGMRPKYGALNFTGYPHGAAASTTYGMSFLELRDILRFNATYTAGDSFALPSGADAAKCIGSFLNFSPVVRHMDNGLLDALVAATKPSFVKGQALPKDSNNNPSYVEAQLHMDVNFGRDVSKLVISNAELAGAANPQVKKTVEKNIAAFVKRFKLVIEYV